MPPGRRPRPGRCLILELLMGATMHGALKTRSVVGPTTRKCWVLVAVEDGLMCPVCSNGRVYTVMPPRRERRGLLDRDQAPRTRGVQC
jgi:hypothetical protein